MSKNNKSQGTKATKTPKPQTQAKPEVKEEKVITPEVVTPDEAKAKTAAKEAKDTGLIKVSVGKQSASKLSPDSKVQLAALMQERYIRNPDTTVEKYGKEFFIEIDEAIDVMVVLALTDARQECLESGIPLLAKGSGKQLLALNAACEIFGIQLPKDQLKIAQKNPEQEVEVNLSDATVNEKTEALIKSDIETRKEYVDKLPNMDPTKVKDEEDLKKTLNYILTKQGHQMARNILDAIEFMRKYRHHLATTADEKLALEDRTIGEWLEEVLSFAKPSLLTSGLISSVCGALSKYGNPIMSHVMLSRQLKGQEAVCPLNDEQIGDMVRTFVKVYHANSLPSLDKDGKEIPKDDLVNTRFVKALINGTEKVLDDVIACETEEAKATFFSARSYYYAITRDNASKFANNNWKEIMRPKLGQILNIYLPLESKLNYDGYPGTITDFPTETEVTEEAKVEEKKS